MDTGNHERRILSPHIDGSDAMSNTGWIKLHRKITDHWLWEDKPFARGQAMIDLLILAGYNDQSKYIDGNLETVERGSVVTSIRRLCDRWGWSN